MLQTLGLAQHFEWEPLTAFFWVKADRLQTGREVKIFSDCLLRLIQPINEESHEWGPTWVSSFDATMLSATGVF